MHRWQQFARPTLVPLLLALAACGPDMTPGPKDSGQTPDSGEVDSGMTANDAGPSNRKIVSLAVTPSTLALKVGQVGGVSAIATFDDGATADVSGSVTWVANPLAVATATVMSAADNLVRVDAVGTGTAAITAKSGTIFSNACTVTVTQNQMMMMDGGVVGPPSEARAVWVTRFAYSTANDVKNIIGKAAAAGFNVVYFQIRGNGDAFYKSSLVPWAKNLSGTLGKDPGWDPLQTAIDEAHTQGIQLHAYWNVFAGWPVPSGCAGAGTCTCEPTQGLSDSCVLPPASPAGQPDHYLRSHPDVMAVNSAGKTVDTEYYWMSAGNPLVQAHVVAVATELLQKYNVDGLHLDRVRYPGASYSHDPGSETAYAAVPAPKPTREDWQRAQVTKVVGQIYAALKQYRPKAALSASVWGIYKPLSGCTTSGGYANYYQDSIGWLKAGVIDAINPMIYWDIGSGCTDWSKHLDVFMAGSSGRHVIAGMHALDDAPSAKDVVLPDRIKGRIDYARKVGAAGITVFASTYLDQAPYMGTGSAWATFRAPPNGPFLTDAGYPEMSWR